MLKFSDRVGGFAREENCVGKIDARKRKRDDVGRQNEKYKYFGLLRILIRLERRFMKIVVE